MQQTQVKLQSINRNLSVDRERLSNACVIGLYVCAGNAMTIKLPSKKSKNTLAHLSIHSSLINGVDVNEVVQAQYNFPSSLDKNKRRDKEVAIFNAISKEIAGQKFKLAKRTNAVKTLKLKIYKEIGPLNKNGVNEFGRKVTATILARKTHSRCSQRSFVEIPAYDTEIMNLFREVSNTQESCTETNLFGNELHVESESSDLRSESLRERIQKSPTEFNQALSAFKPTTVGTYSQEYSQWFFKESN
ncbi:hypothetical protein EIN_430180 [Entamoeba invadens IP1]|uniref:Uncharacterized protein n=1 Tax=Entamoeba invadens IP1 TaxID=370355 RepID=A0A0A1UHF3_ENTIV|nr:hypothetical protein EIN_430180 [Entamoeba invadens IP1]ELP95222.1 hypothetical protein EIN_430180 [Entamoeba invadens IP1]|eukprot:XP_004261993.1 hypothetical protein EIN_430180 [Entamoeba invadens IP1]